MLPGGEGHESVVHGAPGNPESAEDAVNRPGLLSTEQERPGEPLIEQACGIVRSEPGVARSLVSTE